MIHFYSETDNKLNTGFSFYRLTDRHSLGFKFKVKFGKFCKIWMVRYSKMTGHFHFILQTPNLNIDPETGLLK